MEEENSRTLGGDAEKLETFTNTYIQIYRSQVEEEAEKEALTSAELPEFYESFPYKVQWYKMDNDALAGIFLKGDEAPIITLKDGEFHEVRWILEDHACLRFIPLESIEDATPAMAEQIAITHAEDDVEIAKKQKALNAMKKELENLEKQITDMVKVNPWLEDRAAAQLASLSTTKNVIASLEAEIESMEEKRFKTYMSELDRLELLPPPSIREKESMAGMGEDVDQEYLETPPTIGDIQEEVEEEEESFEIETPPTYVEEVKEPSEPIKPPPRKPSYRKKPQPKKETPAFVEVKPRAVRPKMEKMARMELPPEIKNTIFRMNRRLYNLEKKVEPIDRFYTKEIKKMRDDTILLHKEVERFFARNKKEMENFKKTMILELKKTRKKATGLGILAVVISVVALLLTLFFTGAI